MITRFTFFLSKLFALLTLAIIFTTGVMIGLMASAMATEGSIDWRGWKFDYTNERAVGLELTDVYFNNRKILQRMSFPVMRVEYDNDVCGPYTDLIWNNSFNPIQLEPPNDSCNGSEVCARSYEQDGRPILELGINARIGEYQLYQVYLLSPDGYIDANLFSRGLQCDANHRHHAHWMFDFDLDATPNDQVFKNTGDLQVSEFNDLRENTNYWTIRDADTGLAVEVIPGNEDGFPDEFSQWDVAVRKWNQGETSGWRYGARGEIGGLFLNSENINKEDIVLWYVTHIDHKAIDGALDWHLSGARLNVLNASPAQTQTADSPTAPEY